MFRKQTIQSFILYITISAAPDWSAAYASECGVMLLQDNRSNGVSVSENKCTQPSYISIGTKIDLSSNGRLWLKSSQDPVIGKHFQLICQNQTDRSLQLDFSGFLTPWLNLSALNECTGWINNQLRCEGQSGQRNGFFCVLAFEKASSALADSSNIERSTSVKVRGFGNNAAESFDKSQLLAEISNDLVLCKQLNQHVTTLSIRWSVDANKTVSNFNISPEPQLAGNALSECAQTIVSTFNYPVFNKAETFEISL
ncbi:MAG: hypothetical protein K0U68_08755 [Gammaproteobacteria bacterium]|nr:hypothetical protein [Gammaproteobacteria bacterium]